MAKRSRRSIRNKRRSEFVRIARTKTELILEIQDRDGFRTLTYRRDRDKWWWLVNVRNVPVVRKERRKFLLNTQPQTDKHPQRMHRDFPGMLYEVATGEFKSVKERFRVPEARLRAICKKYGKKFD